MRGRRDYALVKENGSGAGASAGSTALAVVVGITAVVAAVLIGLTAWSLSWNSENADAIDLLVLKTDMLMGNDNVTAEALQIKMDNITAIAVDIEQIQSDIQIKMDNITTLAADVEQIQGDIQIKMDNITSLESDLTTIQSDVATLQSFGPLRIKAFAYVRIRPTDAAPPSPVPVIQPGSFGVANVSRIAVGEYRVTLSAPLATTTYVIHASGQCAGVANGGVWEVGHPGVGGPVTTTEFGLRLFKAQTMTLGDPNDVHITVFENS